MAQKKSATTSQKTVLKVKVIPNAPKTEIIEWMGDVLKIKIKAQAQDGAANDALIEHLAKQLKLHKSQIHVISGATARLKLINIEGVVDLSLLL